MKKYLVDTNVILRFFLKDNEVLYQKAFQYFKEAKNKKIELIVLPEVIFEIDYVLRGFYRLDKKETCDLILKLVLTPYIKIPERDVFIQSVKKYQEHSLDLFDLYLYFQSQKQKAKILSFDSDFRRL